MIDLPKKAAIYVRAAPRAVRYNCERERPEANGAKITVAAGTRRKRFPTQEKAQSNNKKRELSKILQKSVFDADHCGGIPHGQRLGFSD